MALIDQLNNVNAVLTFLERTRNLKNAGFITETMYTVMHQACITYLESIFPPPPPVP